jgi:hypothetical protein
MATKISREDSRNQPFSQPDTTTLVWNEITCKPEVLVLNFRPCGCSIYPREGPLPMSRAVMLEGKAADYHLAQYRNAVAWIMENELPTFWQLG